MKEFLDFLHSIQFVKSIKIKFDKEFGDESEVSSLVYQLESSKIIYNIDFRYADVVFDINKAELLKLINEFNYNIDSYNMFKKNITNYNINITGDVKNSQILQDSDLQQSEFHHTETKYPNHPTVIDQKESTMLQKFYNLTNHQIIGGVIAGLILTFILSYFKWK